MINEKLFNLLENAYGSVKVLRQGVAMNCRYKEDPKTDKVRLEVKHRGQGEEYKLDCPECGDTRGRLYVNHRWGVYDKKTKTRNLWLANCYNEECFKDYAAQKKLYDNVYGGFTMNAGDMEKPTSVARALVVQEIELPGTVWPLADMLKRQPNHHSLQYLRDRLIDPESVAEQYDLSYCLETYMSLAENRIIVPMKQNGKLVGWQARYIGEIVSKDCPKYYTGPGTALNQLWYNSDVARTYYTKVIVEGCIDAWMVGPQAMAIFNKKIGDERLQTMFRLMSKMEDFGNFVILLDPDENVKDIKGKDHKHHSVHVAELFKKWFPGRVMEVRLPAHTDPGSLDRVFIWKLIYAVAAERGFRISNDRIARKKGTDKKWSSKSNEPRPVSLRTGPSGQ